jgi:hypothetical protein
MKPETRKWLQIALAVAIVAAGVRLVVVMKGRNNPAAAGAGAKPAPPLNANYYVVPKKLYPFDLKSARQLAQQPVWVKEGYRYTYYPYEPSRRRADFKTEAGTLGPIEKLDIKDVIPETGPGGQKLVMATFEKDGNPYAVQIGTVNGKDYRIYSDEMFYIQDPHQLYGFWPKEVWTAIASHQVKAGMDELQTDFAIGMGVPQRQEDPAIKTVDYPNGGKPLQVTFRDGKAVDVKPGTAGASS